MASDKAAANFILEAGKRGFSAEQASFLYNFLAQKPHQHLASEIVVDPEDGQTLDDFVEATTESVNELEEAVYEDEGQPDETAAVVVDEED